MRVGRGSAYLVAQSLVTVLVGAVSFAFVARVLTQAEMGVVVVLMLIAGVVQLLSDLGFGSGLAKYVAEFIGRDLDYTCITFVGILTKVLLAGVFSLFCALSASQLSFMMFKSGDYAFLFQLLSVDIFFVCVTSTIGSLLLGLNRIAQIAALNVIVSVTRQSFGVIFLVFGYGLVGLVVGWILGDFTYVALSSVVLLRGGHIKLHSARKVILHFKMLAKFSWPLFLMNIVVFLYSWFDRAALLAYIPLSEVAVYNVALTAFGVLNIIPAALSTALFPYFSEQYGKNMHEKVVAAVNASTRYVTLLYTPLALGLMVTANPALTIFAGEKYAGGFVILAVLSLLGALVGMGAALGVLLLVYNMTGTILVINVFSTVFGVVASILVLPFFGAVGIAVVKGTVMIVSFVLTVVFLRRRVPIRFDREAVWKGWSAALLMALVVGLIAQLYPNRILLPVYILIGGVVYTVALRISKAIEKQDLQVIQNLMGKRAGPIVGFLERILVP